MSIFVPLRVLQEHELEGLDISQPGEVRQKRVIRKAAPKA
jgi:hypothetical protein